MIADPEAPTAAVVMGRAEGLPTITLPTAEVPLLRFLDRVQVHYPGVELVVDCDLTGDGDLYLPDHYLDGDLLFPAVFGMEAMTQAASALTGRSGAPALSDVEFLRPIVVPVEGSTTLRVAVLATGPDTVRAVIRSGETGFQADHFRATLPMAAALPDRGRRRRRAAVPAGGPGPGALRPGAVPGPPVPAAARLPAAGRQALRRGRSATARPRRGSRRSCPASSCSPTRARATR